MFSPESGNVLHQKRQCFEVKAAMFLPFSRIKKQPNGICYRMLNELWHGICVLLKQLNLIR
jgi:hypothetical protein